MPETRAGVTSTLTARGYPCCLERMPGPARQACAATTMGYCYARAVPASHASRVQSGSACRAGAPHLALASPHPYASGWPMAQRQASTDSAQGFSVSRTVVDDRICVVVVTGEVDVATAPAFRDALTAAVEDENTDGIVVELSGVSFLDSTALNALVRCFEQQKRRLQGLSLVSSDTRVRALLEVTRLDRLLQVFPTRDEAIARVLDAA